jgi:ribosomal protein L11 methyltransferase
MDKTFELIVHCKHTELTLIKRFLSHLDRQDFVESLVDLDSNSAHSNTLISVFDESKQSLVFIQAKIHEQFESTTEIREYSSVLWKNAWEEDFSGFESDHFNFTTCEPPSPSTILIEPIGAFGLGDHATTKATIILLERALKRNSVVTRSFLDVGCGTGIFAIWAAKFGFQNIVATDIDDIAIQSTIRNRTLNQVNFEVFKDSTPPQGSFDVVVSNILPPALNLLFPIFKERLKANGKLFIAGFNEANILDVEKDWKLVGFEQVSSQTERGWIAVELGLKDLV